MGLDAFVRCRCWEEGKTTPPPWPAGTISIDESGVIDLCESSRGNIALLQAARMWRMNCCPHPNMTYVGDRIDNWFGYRRFLEALAASGWEHYPTLNAELPRANGDGSTQPDASKLALEELRFFEEHADLGTNTVLFDADTGYILYEYVEGYGGEYYWYGREYGLFVALDSSAFYITNADDREKEGSDRRVRFRSDHFEQVRIDPKTFEFRDVAGSQVFHSGFGLSYDAPVTNPPLAPPKIYPKRLKVEVRKRDIAEFEHTLKALRTVFTASVEIGQPVWWC